MPSVEEQSELPGAGDMRPIRLRKLEATQRLLGDTIAIDERSWQEPCHLPGWTRAHVATHLARNADAFTRVAAGMMTGINTPLYISERERFNDIERGSERRGLDLQVDLDTSAGRLYHGLDELGDIDGSRLVEISPGRKLRIDLLPLARLREVALHHVDLACGFTVLDMDDDIARWVLEWTCYWIGDDPRLAPLQIESTSGFHTRLGGTGRPTAVGGSDALLLGWLTNRLPDDPSVAKTLPALPEGWWA
ncbi:Hypothetical protein PFCIRM512_06615 [Propionibacterium freudenreichii]|uniref:maleylpyruvate isomerase family mycothiol-dependent enzyme n=1 Tax=Propionibacterium freudenreichii TaxID=1744 RepID=UPI0005A5CCC6|nr:maleylpyruvate isomerase family mycothiol-dependent enzyme [Propionibacterium freudenreichii]CEI23250.1 Hypothetical protein PFCIRM512_06615 [Propionibacterium freudenreichii]